jgi:mRNA-degrading endonuclease RelE of RelBE toxin-antitoxin system
LLPDACELTTQSWNVELILRKATSSMQEPYSAQSTKQTKYDTVVPAGQKPWTVKLHRDPGKDVANYGLCDPTFSPTLGELISALEANPKQFPKKHGPLKDCRAAPLKFKGKSFRAVFILDETARIVFILAIDPHDEAYDKAIRRC